MFKKILLIITMLYAAAAFAAVDVNKATAAELDGIKGIGPGLSTKILDERKNGDFKDWSDFIGRVSGVGEKTAARFSSEGLTVNGKKFSAAAVAKTKAKAEKADKSEKKAKAADKAGAATKGKGEQKPAAAAPAADAPAAPATPAAADGATKK
jgi:competence protein ComEA